jgi:hypothetical protein
MEVKKNAIPARLCVSFTAMLLLSGCQPQNQAPSKPQQKPQQTESPQAPHAPIGRPPPPRGKIIIGVAERDNSGRQKPDSGRQEPYPMSEFLIEVDEGNTCRLPELGKNETLVKRSCCNASVCEGICNQYPCESAPVCSCAGVTGGCPAPHVCCLYPTVHCTNVEDCKTH